MLLVGTERGPFIFQTKLNISDINNNTTILYFHLQYFHVSNSALFFTWCFCTLILHIRSFDTFYSNDYIIDSFMYEYLYGNIPDIFRHYLM